MPGTSAIAQALQQLEIQRMEEEMRIQAQMNAINATYWEEAYAARLEARRLYLEQEAEYWEAVRIENDKIRTDNMASNLNFGLF